MGECDESEQEMAIGEHAVGEAEEEKKRKDDIYSPTHIPTSLLNPFEDFNRKVCTASSASEDALCLVTLAKNTRRNAGLGACSPG